MLAIYFTFRGKEYKGNRIPETYQNLQQAASKIMEIHTKSSEPINDKFSFKYTIPN